MKISRKHWLALFCLVLALLMLAACGSKKTQEVSAPAPTPIVVYVTPVPTATPEPRTTPIPTATPEGNATPVPTLPPLEPAATKAPSPAPTAAPTPTPTAVPTPTPLNSAPVITKSPTDERLTEGGTCLFVARADYASSIVWHFVSPDGYTDLEYSSIYGYFPSLRVGGGTENTLRLSNVPYDLNGWRVYCRFSNSLGSSSSGQAVVSVSAAATPTPVPVTPAPEPAYDDTDYSGNYYEAVGGRGMMTISGGPSHYDVVVTWSSSAFETSTWTFSGTFDTSGTMYFSDCARVTDTYYEDGSYDTTTDYAWATGTLSITGASGFVWNVNGDSDISGSVFQ